MHDDDIARSIREAASKLRPYASFFDWPQREVAEWGVATAFVEAAVTEPGMPFRDLQSRARGDDPPDCEVLDAHGRRLALEITELVEGEAIAQARRTTRVIWADWDRPRFLAKLQGCLNEKDAKVLKGGPYDEYIVLVHTDEPVLAADTVEQWLSDYTFATPTQIDRAYLLLSYDPRRTGYPYFRLGWRKAQN